MDIPELILVALLLFVGNNSEVAHDSSEHAVHLMVPRSESLIQKYEHSANVSKVLQRDDKKIMATWAEEYQVKRLDVSVKYRVQMINHEEHCFKSNGNLKWLDCLYIHRKEIRRSKSLYHENELECLRASTSKDANKKADVEQLEKQITNWRKGYRYLVNLCEVENPVNEVNAQRCLVKYMQNDNYDRVIERLIILKQSAMSELYAYYNSSLIDLEECLKSQLSRYLDRVRSIMETLNKCYSIRY